MAILMPGSRVGNVRVASTTLWDPGYSLCSPGTTHHKLAQAGINQTFQPVTHQRGTRPFSGEALIDGRLYSPLLPQDLRDLPSPPRDASEAEKLAYEDKFNQRARWRMVRHPGRMPTAPPGGAGLLRSRSSRSTMRRAKTVPLVSIDEGCKACSSGTLSAMAVDFVNHFAADVDRVREKVMYAVQQPLAATAFNHVITVPAWRSLPSW